MLLNHFHCGWTSWNHGILTEWYPHSALDEVALGMCEHSGLTLMLEFGLVSFSFLYWDQNVFKCRLISTSESACIRHLLLSSGDLQKWVYDSWVNIFLVCSELFHSIEFYVFIGRSWDLFVLLSTGRKVLENKEKRCPRGGGGSTGTGMWCLQSPVPICSRRKWLTSPRYLTGALCDKSCDKALNTLWIGKGSHPYRTKPDAKIKTCISAKEKLSKAWE